MPKHDLGIMQDAPTAHVRYDSYTSEKYDRLSADGDNILPLLERLRGGHRAYAA